MTSTPEPLHPDQRAPRRTPVNIAAIVVTETFAPAFIVAALLLLVAWHGSNRLGQALWWGLSAVLFASVIPLVYVLLAVHRKRLTRRHVPVRSQRPKPLLIAIASLTIGVFLLSRWGAPRDLVSLTGTMTAGLLTVLVVTWFWKISIHTAVAAGAVVIVAEIFGLGWLGLAPVVALVAWARVTTGGHTRAQAVAGAALGAAIAASVFPLLR